MYRGLYDQTVANGVGRLKTDELRRLKTWWFGLHIRGPDCWRRRVRTPAPGTGPATDRWITLWCTTDRRMEEQEEEREQARRRRRRRRLQQEEEVEAEADGGR